MMILLIVFIVLLLPGVLILLFMPWSENHIIERDEINRIFYHSRLKELSKDNEPFRVVDRTNMIVELQYNLLQDTPQQKISTQKPLNRWVLFPSVLVLLFISLGVFLQISDIPQLLKWQKITHQTPKLLQRVMDSQMKPLTREELTDLTLGLRTQLQNSPSNHEGWRILGRFGIELNNPIMAKQAFEKAYLLKPDNIEIKLDYIEILLYDFTPRNSQTVNKILNNMLPDNYTNLRLLNLFALNFLKNKQYKEAIAILEKILLILPKNDKQRETIEHNILQINSYLKNREKY
ncbi:c-type cytochrome biogenesis protein CcmI [Xenorhabdus khoisanae]|uniref:c-type cytochrome biogenesis protein CcmI n=1 Tax=Xenorhabdus khoisanae TaxID=880157 RepID=UPI0032B7811C